MAITITVEDGTLVDGANSYVSIADAKAYALNRGVTLDNSLVPQQLIIAMDYFVSFRRQWEGTKVSPDQALQWPRKDVEIDGSILLETVIPQELKDAQCQLVMALFSGIDILPNRGAGNLPVIKDETGPLKTTYAKPVDLNGFSWDNVDLPMVDDLLAPLLISAGFKLHTVRI